MATQLTRPRQGWPQPVVNIRSVDCAGRTNYLGIWWLACPDGSHRLALSCVVAQCSKAKIRPDRQCRDRVLSRSARQWSAHLVWLLRPEAKSGGDRSEPLM
jgi:hypothetical protein